MEIPMLASDLIKELRKLYPHRHPSPGMTVEQIWYRAGQSSVVDGLEANLRAQEDNILEQSIAKRS